jgi:DnaJ like chaperone protein
LAVAITSSRPAALAAGAAWPTLEDACNVLGVKPTDDQTTIKRAYRKLMSEHHPDKLVAKGLPPE